MKLSHFAKLKGVHYRTAYNWFKVGLIPNANQLSNGTIIVNEEIKINTIEIIVTYARVSNASRRNELNYQVKRLSDFCENKGWPINKEYYEVASGMNDSRKQLWKMIEQKPTKIVIENKDRLTRFGFEYLRKLLKNQGTEIIIINEAITDEQDLIRDLVSIITSFCCRLYGLRRGYNKAKQINEQIKNDSN